MTTAQPRPRICYFIHPTDGYVEGEGWRPSIVTEGEPGHAPNGCWPYDVRKPRPWFWGHDYEKAKAMAARANENLGLSERDVDEIIASSMVTRVEEDSE